MKKILVTGPDGFVGTALCAELLERGFAVRGAQWQPAPLPAGCESVVVGNIGGETDWSDVLVGVDTVVHLAARVHMMKDQAADPLAAFRAVNVEGTRRLAEAAAKSGVRRFILMSTVKVNGEETGDDGLTSVFSESDNATPQDAYGISKMEAERTVLEAAENPTMETVIIRAPLIYGPGVKGNMRSLLNLAATGFPLPFGAARNRRSLLYLGNLTDFISLSIDHPAAANEKFLVSDNNDLSTTELLCEIRRAMGKAPILIPVPSVCFRLAGRLTGKSAVVNRLFGSLQVDCSKAIRLLEWQPPFTAAEGVRAMVAQEFSANETN